MRKILLVDDDELIIEVVKEYLSEHKMQVVTASNGQDGVNQAIHEQPELILLDINMPDMDGYEVLKVLKSRAITSFIPVIMLTGKQSSTAQVTGLVSGADDYVTKPFDLNILHARILSALRRSLLITRMKYDQFNLLNFFVAKYKKRGYTCYSKLVEELPDHPQNWKGFVADFIIEKAGKVRAFQFENAQTILEEAFIDRLKELSNPELYKKFKSLECDVIVRSKEIFRDVKRIINEYGFAVKLKYVSKQTTVSKESLTY